MMGKRLSKIVTRTGDDGSTGLADGSRTTKDSVRIAIIGGVDELNSQLGLVLTEDLPQDVRELLLQLQNDLFDLGGALSLPQTGEFPESKLTRLDTACAHYNADLPQLQDFILPGGCRAAAQCHVSRSVARRIEREYLALSHMEPVPPYGLPYLNRLSDLLFILCRVLNRAAGCDETLWRHPPLAQA
jgi:cob(I)alamin adenosyltransferase